MLRRDLKNAIRKKRPAIAENFENIIYHHDNAPAHTSSATRLEIEFPEFQLIDHPPYSPDLAPMDFSVFPYIKVHTSSQLLGRKFENSFELKTATMNIITKIDTEWYSYVFSKWVYRHSKCIQCGGEYFEKE